MSQFTIVTVSLRRLEVNSKTIWIMFWGQALAFSLNCLSVGKVVIFSSQGYLVFQAPTVTAEFGNYWLMWLFLSVSSFQPEEHWLCSRLFVVDFFSSFLQMDLKLTWPPLFNCFCLPREAILVHQTPSIFISESVTMLLKLWD